MLIIPQKNKNKNRFFWINDEKKNHPSLAYAEPDRSHEVLIRDPGPTVEH